MQLVNISHSEDGRHLRVNLGTDWARMFEQLVLAKVGLLMTRNAVAILERHMKYPALSVTSGGGKGASGHGGLWVNFGRLGAARAVHVRQKTGHLFGVEFANAAGQIVQRFTLTKESDMDEFFAWARLHQACAAHSAASWLEETEEEITPQEAMRTLWCCGRGAFQAIMAACVDSAMPVRVTLYGKSVTQRVEFVPRFLQTGEDWWLASDDVTGLHFQPKLFTRVSLEQQKKSNRGSRIIVRVAMEDDMTALILEAGCQAVEEAWNALLEGTV
ncbi:MAG: hypothetical protein JWL59_2050 [Chthoniobacteraceae bacterium]|nr:hypothetical protein [Chthoniobacteraceae bacterium]